MSAGADPGETSPAAVESEVLRAIRPTPEFMARLERVRAALLARTEEIVAATKSRMARGLIAGSAARGGFLSDRVDIDLFLLFPPTLKRVELQTEGLQLARAILPDHEIRYAEHPYLRGQFEGFRVDAVPGYAVADGAHPQSAVDRTPFHQEYLVARETPSLIDQVRLAKQFLRSLGVYGSEARTGGFSGYLVELLVVRFGSLDALLSEARRWRPPVRLVSTPGASPRVPEETALILDDPVDPARNVSSALSRQNLAKFVLAAGAYLDRPSPESFRPPRAVTLSRAEGLVAISERGTHVAALRLPRPPLVDDVLYPQLRRAERGLRDGAERLGFQPIGTGAGADPGGLVLLLEVASGNLPVARVRDGPPVGLDRVGSFLEKWSADPASILQGPYVRADGTLAVETRREERQLERLLEGELPQLPLGQDLRKIAAGGRMVPLSESPDDEALGIALAELLLKSLPPWMSGGRSRPGPPG